VNPRILAVTAAGAVLAAVAVGYTVHAAGRSVPPAAAGEAPATGLYVRTTAGNIAVRREAGGGYAETGLRCHRFYLAGDTAICLSAAPGLTPRTTATVLGRDLRPRRTVTFGGTPNRARVSPSGRMASWTVFVTGDSYAATGFSTRTGILDTRTGYLIKNLESIQLYVDGRRHHAPDVNYWGVTFTRDDNRFYATMSTRGRTHLIEGDLSAWTARTLRTNVECPSLSPDGTRLAFKKRVRPGTANPWQLHVLDLRTMRETPLAETRSVDDQAAWLDDTTLAYALPGAVWSVPADGTGSPTVLAPAATSPAMAR
jgi:hypothetical protein